MLHAKKISPALPPHDYRRGQEKGKGWCMSWLIMSARGAKRWKAARHRKADAWQHLARIAAARGLGERSLEDSCSPPLFRRPPVYLGDAYLPRVGAAAAAWHELALTHTDHAVLLQLDLQGGFQQERLEAIEGGVPITVTYSIEVASQTGIVVRCRGLLENH
jgi:hypothetical protein